MFAIAGMGIVKSALIARLMSFQKQFPGRVTCLRENHEEMLLLPCRESISYERWISDGGAANLE
jgi:hypothetical protein